MVTPSTPPCLRCGGPMFVHWIKGYVCPYCRQIDETRRVANQVARQQVHYQDSDYYDNQTPVYVDNSGDDSIIASTLGCLVTLFAFGVMAGIVVGIWNSVVHPVLHFITFGLI